jgi:hypothetical protein
MVPPQDRGGDDTVAMAPTPAVRARSGFKGVSRIDNPKKNSYGWFARVSYAGKIHSRFFSDSVHGGDPAALRKAVEWRDQTEHAPGKPRTDRVVTTAPTRGRSGVPGIQRFGDRYVAAWSPEPGTLRRASFSIAKLGDAEAFARALAFRQQQERALYGAPLPLDRNTRGGGGGAA